MTPLHVHLSLPPNTLYFEGKERKRVDKSIASSQVSEPDTAAGVSREALREVLEQIKREEVPIPPQEKENYFMSHVSMGEQLSMQGMDH